MEDNAFLVTWYEEDLNKEDSVKTVFALLSADKESVLDVICEYDGRIEPVYIDKPSFFYPLYYHGGGVNYAVPFTVSDKNKTLILFFDESDTVSAGVIDRVSKQFSVLITDVMGDALALISKTESDINSDYIPFREQINNSFEVNGLTKAWFSTSGNGWGENYFSICLETGELELINDRAGNSHGAQTYIIKDNIRAGFHFNSGMYWTSHGVFLIGEEEPFISSYKILGISDDEKEFVLLHHNLESRHSVYQLVEYYDGIAHEIEFSGNPQPTYLFTDFKNKFFVFYFDGEFIFYNYKDKIKTTLNDLPPIYYETKNAEALFIEGVFHTGDVDEYGYEIYSEAVCFLDGTVISIKNKFPWLYTTNGKNIRYSGMICIGMWGGSNQPQTFWTQLKNTAEVI